MTLSPAARQRAMFIILCFVWGTTWLAMKVGISAVPPGVFAGSRWTMAGIILLLARLRRGEPIRPTPRIAGRLLLVAILMVALNQVVQLYALKVISAGLAAVINCALTPIALLGFAVILRQERFNLRQLLAMGVGVLGILVLFGPSAIDGTLTVWTVLGAAGVITACLSYSLGSVLARRLMLTLAPGQMAALTNLVGGLVILNVSLPLEPGAGPALHFHWGWPAFLAWLYLLLLGSVMCTSIYFRLVREWGASRTGTYAFVSPVVAVVLGATLFGEHVDPSDVFGMALMLLAAALALWSRRPLPPAPQPALAGGDSRQGQY